MDILTLTYLIKLFLLPPTSLLLMAFAGLLLRKHPVGLPLTVVSLTLLTALSLPIVSKTIAATLENQPIVEAGQIQRFKPQAIVVLGGGSTFGKEYGQPLTANDRTLLRLRYAAKLARDTHLPILVSGGKVFPDAALSEAQIMAGILQDEFNVPVVWQEANSRNTAENARFSHQLLQAQGIDKIILVTQAYHLPRALELFRQEGFQVLPAPTAFIKYKPSLSLFSFIPSATALENSFLVLHEYLGLLWYRISR
ncbi:MAG: YdcF family protein [Methylovulum sp.]|nr:YdcF family protein [Methylovulum sp.]